MPLTPDLARRTERWFIRRGVPHFIHDYSATEDVLTRTLPFLVLVFLLEVVGAVNEGWPLWANVLSALGGLALLIGGWTLANRLRGRPSLTRPDRVAGPEVAVFVLVPALLPLVFGGDAGQSAVVVAANVLVLAAAYLATSYGVVPMTRWAMSRLIAQVGATVGLFARALPLLLLAFMFLFINAEVWDVASDLNAALLIPTFGLLAALALVFVAVRLPAEVRSQARFDDWAEVARYAAGSPMAGVQPLSARPERVADLTRREWANLGLVAIFSQVVQIAMVSALIGGFFVAFGFLAISPETVAGWTGNVGSPDVLASWMVSGRRLVVSVELLKVAGFLGTFAGLYFAVYVVQDAAFRSEFFEKIAKEARQTLAVRALYRDAIREGH